MKAKERVGSRFFGEAYAASQVFKDTKCGWYNSYKWLTGEKWISGIGLKSEYEGQFHKALLEFIGAPKLREMQNKALDHHLTYRGKKTVAPDFWMIDELDHFHFAEMKMPWDQISDHQITGMKIIKDCLENCSVVEINSQLKIA